MGGGDVGGGDVGGGDVGGGGCGGRVEVRIGKASYTGKFVCFFVVFLRFTCMLSLLRPPYTQHSNTKTAKNMTF